MMAGIRPSLVSVIIPVFNGERYLAEAIDSVFAQGYAPLEVIIVDDGSTDGSVRVARSFGSRVTLLRKPHAGLGATRNQGVRSATGEFLAFLDADDVWLGGKLQLQIASLVDDPDLDLVFGQAREFASPDVAEHVSKNLRWSEDPTPARMASTTLVRHAAFRRVGFFDEDLALGEFIDWLARAHRCGLKEVVLPEVLALRRVHDNNTSVRNQRERRVDYLRALRSAIGGRSEHDSGAETDETLEPGTP